MQKAKRLKKLMQAQPARSTGGASCSDNTCNHDHAVSPLGIPLSRLNPVIDRKREELAMAEQALPPSAFDEWKGQFWEIPETQPFMKAKLVLAQALRMRGDYAEAAVHLRELLELNPADNQGNRWYLWPTLIDLSKTEPAALDEMESILANYEDEPIASTVYSKALMLFRKGGATPEAKTALKHAFEKNKHVIPLLIRRYPDSHIVTPEVTIGSLQEAYGYVWQSWHQWRETDGWKEFLATATDS